MKRVTLQPVHADADDEREALQAVLEGAPAFFVRSSGAPARTNEAEELLSALPPGRSLEDKRVLGVFLDDEMIGCVDVILGWPSASVAMIGLFLLRESHQRRGLGTSAFRCLALHLHGLGFERLRIGVIHDYGAALAFWRGLGFVETGERRAHFEGTFRTDVIVLERDTVLTSTLPRQG